ncbi:hypothetical protein EST38_g9317 [Candolleomyces aberdarensis]|uniref:Uncharacterized protein n=1 Tax=Candolleomyces aberdarensis TaxID=2316362 RepID=A0A4Q2DA80_9AGAR|nr:hypothetical protein EST38_g9317 [Candolleomyces aberdarensis]
MPWCDVQIPPEKAKENPLHINKVLCVPIHTQDGLKVQDPFGRLHNIAIRHTTIPHGRPRKMQETGKD